MSAFAEIIIVFVLATLLGLIFERVCNILSVLCPRESDGSQGEPRGPGGAEPHEQRWGAPSTAHIVGVDVLTTFDSCHCELCRRRNSVEMLCWEGGNNHRSSSHDDDEQQAAGLIRDQETSMITTTIVTPSHSRRHSYTNPTFVPSSPLITILHVPSVRVSAPSTPTTSSSDESLENSSGDNSSDGPPPSYDNFEPPDYDSLNHLLTV